MGFASSFIRKQIKNQTNNTISGAVGSVNKYVGGAISSVTSRLNNAGLSVGGRSSAPRSGATAKFTDEDWRVRLSVPASGVFYNDPSNEILAPLRGTNGMIYPYTPMIMLSHSASYAASQPTHSNYAQHFYGGSSIDMITVTGDFTAQNQTEARYVLAVLTFLRSASKMFWGKDENAGTPPPVLRLNGYGDHIFNNVPVVLTNFNFELGADVDYINANVSTTTPTITAPNGQPFRRASTNISPTRVPTKTAIAVTLQPLYSRQQMKEFGLKDFASGQLIGDRKTGKGGFI